MPPWFKVIPGAIELLLLIQPRASRTRIVGEHDGRLKIQLAAPPVDGEANAALLDFLSALLQVRKSAVELLDGQQGRRKRVKVSGLDAAALSALLSTQ